MPDLPTITVTTDQQTRILAAFQDLFGTATQADTVAEYKKMIARIVKQQVLSYEQKQAAANASTQVDTYMQGLVT